MDQLDNIQDHIYVIRGYRVILDFDLAKLYEVKTKVLNQAVKRNSKRFEGEEFMFQLSKDEWISFTKSVHNRIFNKANDNSFSDNYNLRSQIVTSRFSDNWGGSRTQPYAFTEIGVAMLSSVLKSEVAIQANRKNHDISNLRSQLKNAWGMGLMTNKEKNINNNIFIII